MGFLGLDAQSGPIFAKAMEQRASKAAPQVHQAAGVWIWPWQQKWKEQEGFSILGEKDFSSPTTQHNEVMHVSTPIFF